MNRSKLILVLTASCLTPLALLAETRVFTSSDGKKIEASVLEVSDDKSSAVIESKGRKFTLPLNRLSAEDQEYLKNWKPAGSSSAAADGGWAQWRGPNRDGISDETGLQKEWSGDGPELLWRTKDLGSAMSSVAISGGKLYTLGESGGKTFLHCRSLEDGAEIWSTEVGGNGQPNCTPTIDAEAGLAFSVSRGGDLACVNIETGEQLWRKNFESDFGGKMMSGWGYSESPLVDGDRLICTPGAQDGMIAALEKSTGEVIWKTDVSGEDLGSAGGEGAAYGSIVISNGGGVKQYVQLVGRGLIGVAADDGRFLWNYNRIANGTANVPTAIIKDDFVFGSTGYGDGGSALLELSKSGGDGVKAREVYYKDSKELQNHHGGMVLVGEHIYMGEGHNNGFPACVNLSDGKDEWERGRGAGSGSAAVVYADGLLFYRYEDHVMAIVEANPEEYRLKGQFKIASSNGKSWAHPVIVDGKLYLRDQDELLVYNIKG